jgi:hypothetical protein
MTFSGMSKLNPIMNSDEAIALSAGYFSVSIKGLSESKTINLQTIAGINISLLMVNDDIIRLFNEWNLRDRV